MPRPPSTSPFKAMEEEAYHAFREWPVWLVLREKELANYLAADRPQTHARAASAARATSEPPEENQS